MPEGKIFSWPPRFDTLSFAAALAVGMAIGAPAAEAPVATGAMVVQTGAAAYIPENLRDKFGWLPNQLPKNLKDDYPQPPRQVGKTVVLKG